MKEKKKAVIYARYSSHHQTEMSIEGQVADCMQFAEENDLEVVKIYADRAQTGTNDNRAEFQQMLFDSGKGVFESVLVWKLDRFGRNREEIAVNKVKLKKNGVRVLYVKESIPDGPEGIILESVLEGMAEYYSANLAQNVTRGMRQNAEKGLYNGGPVPFWLRVVDGRFELHPILAPLATKVFEMYGNGSTLKSAFKDLNLGSYTTDAGKKVTLNMIYKMIPNEKAIGIYSYKGQVIGETIPPIVTKELFLLCQKKRNATLRGGNRRQKSAYPLCPKAFCEKCGKPYVASAGTSSTGNLYKYYMCESRKNGKGCDNKTYRQDILEDFIIKETKQYILTDKNINFIADKAMDLQNDRQKLDETEVLKNQLKDINKKIANIMKAIEDGIYTTTTRDRLAELEAEKENINILISKKKLEDKCLTKESIVWYLNKIKEDATGKKIIDCLISAVLIGPEEITIIFNYTDDIKKTPHESVNAFIRRSSETIMVTHGRLERPTP